MYVIAEHLLSTAPQTFLSLGRDFVADTFTDNLTLELCKQSENVQRQSSHRIGRINLLSYRYKGHTISIKGLPRSCEGGARAT